MASWNSPAVARRWLAHELRQRRDERELAQRDVGKACGWSGVRVSYIENAQQSVTDDDLAKLLPLYDVPAAAWPEYYDAARASRERGWWERYSDDVVPRYLSDFIGLEQGASRILTYEPTIVPGLLQTRDYMEAVIATDMRARTPRLIRQIIDVREARQEVLTREAEPAELAVVVDESVLRRVVGGPGLMAAQLRHIADLCARPNVTFRVFPLAYGVSPGQLIASVRILHFAGSTPPGVYLEAREDATWIDGGEAVDAHDLAFERVANGSLGPQQSIDLLSESADRYAAHAD
jgi:transcriptional regulator with XRE-family HTH domain